MVAWTRDSAVHTIFLFTGKSDFLYQIPPLGGRSFCRVVSAFSPVHTTCSGGPPVLRLAVPSASNAATVRSGLTAGAGRLAATRRESSQRCSASMAEVRISIVIVNQSRCVIVRISSQMARASRGTSIWPSHIWAHLGNLGIIDRVARSAGWRASADCRPSFSVRCSFTHSNTSRVTSSCDQ